MKADIGVLSLELALVTLVVAVCSSELMDG